MRKNHLVCALFFIFLNGCAAVNFFDNLEKRHVSFFIENKSGMNIETVKILDTDYDTILICSNVKNNEIALIHFHAKIQQYIVLVSTQSKKTEYIIHINRDNSIDFIGQAQNDRIVVRATDLQ